MSSLVHCGVLPFIGGAALATGIIYTYINRRFGGIRTHAHSSLDGSESLNLAEVFKQAGADTSYGSKVSPYNWILSQSSKPEDRVRRQYFYFHDSRRLVALVTFGTHTEGPPGRVHGGCSASVLDSLAGGVAYRSLEGPIVTANLTVNYRSSIPTNSTAVMEAMVRKVEGRKVHVVFRSMPIQQWQELVTASGETLPPFPSDDDLVPKSSAVSGLCQYGSALFIGISK